MIQVFHYKEGGRRYNDVTLTLLTWESQDLPKIKFKKILFYINQNQLTGTFAEFMNSGPFTQFLLEKKAGSGLNVVKKQDGFEKSLSS